MLPLTLPELNVTEYDGLLDATLVRRLLDEERLMKNGESDGFRLQLDCRWYVELRKEDGPRVAPFKYAIEAYCLDNINLSHVGTSAWKRHCCIA